MNRVSKISIFAALIAQMGAVAAQPVFTEEQRREIESIVLAKRVQIEEAVLERLKATGALPQSYDWQELRSATPRAIPPSPSSETAVLPKPVKSIVTTALPAPTADVFLSGIGNTVFTSPVETERAGFEISGNTESSKATIKLSRRIGDATPGANPSFSTFAITASAPLDKNDNEFTNLSTLDGMTNAFEIALKFSRFHGLRRADRSIDSHGNLDSGFEETCRLAGKDPDKDNGCELGEVEKGLRDRGLDAASRNFKSYFFDTNSFRWTYGAQASLGYEEFKYFRPSNLSKAEDGENPWTVEGYVGVVPPRMAALFTIGVEYQDAFKAANAKTVCPLQLGRASLDCVSGSIGAPEQSEKHLAYVEWRSRFQGFAFSLRATHDFKNDDTGVDLPIYLITDKDGKLNAGVRAGWTNTDAATVGVFAGSAFTLFQ